MRHVLSCITNLKFSHVPNCNNCKTLSLRHRPAPPRQHRQHRQVGAAACTNALLSAPSQAAVEGVGARSPRSRPLLHAHIPWTLIVCCDPAVKLHISITTRFTVVISAWRPRKFGRRPSLAPARFNRPLFCSERGGHWQVVIATNIVPRPLLAPRRCRSRVRARRPPRPRPSPAPRRPHVHNVYIILFSTYT